MDERADAEGGRNTGADEGIDVDALIARFRERAARVRERPIPPIAGPERQRYIEQAELDYMDFALIGDAEGELVNGILTLRVDLRPPEQR